MDSFMASGNGFGLQGDLRVFDPEVWKKASQHAHPNSHQADPNRFYSYVVNPRGDNIFLHISPSEGHQIIAGLIFYSMWMGALGWDIVSTLHVDVRIARETRWRSFPSAVHSIAYFLSRYVSLTWLIQTVIYVTTQTDDCNAKMTASIVSFSIGLCSTTLVFCLRTINIWHLRRRVAFPLLASWTLIVGCCVALSWKGTYAYNMLSGADFCTWHLSRTYSVAVVCAVFIFDIVAFWLTALKLNRDGWAGLLKSLWPSTKQNLDAEDVAVMLMQRTTVFFFMQFCLLWICLGVFLGRQSIWYRIMLPVAIQAIGSSMAGRIFRKAWILTRLKENQGGNINKPPSYFPGWAEDRAERSPDRRSTTNGMRERGRNGISFNVVNADGDFGRRGRGGRELGQQEDVTATGIAFATAAGSAFGGEAGVGISKWCMPMGKSSKAKSFDDSHSIETYIEGEFKRSPPSTTASDRSGNNLSLPLSDPEQNSAAALYAQQHRSGSHRLRHSRSAQEGLRSSKSNTSSRQRNTGGRNKLSRAFRSTGSASASELDLSNQDREEFFGGVGETPSRAPIPPEMFEISANTLFPPGPNRFSSFSNGDVSGGPVVLGLSSRRSSSRATKTPRKPDAALTVSAGLSTHSNNLSSSRSEKRRGAGKSSQLQRIQAGVKASAGDDPTSPTRTVASLPTFNFTSSTNGAKSSSSRHSRRSVAAAASSRGGLEESETQIIDQSHGLVSRPATSSGDPVRPSSSAGRPTASSPRTAAAQLVDSRRSFIASPPMMTNSAPKPWRSQDRNAYDLDAVRAAAASGKGPSEPQPRMSKTRRTSLGHPPQVRPSSSGGSSLSFANFHNRGAEDRGSSSSNRPNSAPSREIESRLKAASSTSDYAQDEGDDVLHAFRALVAADADARTENSSFDIPSVSSASNVEKEEDDGRPRTSKGGGGIGSFASHHNRRSTLRQEESNDVRPSTATGEGQPKPFGLGVVTNGNSNGKGRFRSSSQSYTINESSNHPQLSPTSPVFAFAHDSAMPTSSTPQSQYSVPSKTSSSSRPSVSSILPPPPPSFVEAIEAEADPSSDVDSTGQHCSAIERQYRKLEKFAASAPTDFSDSEVGSDSTHSHSLSLSKSHSFTR